MGQTRYGVYHDDCQDVHPDLINQFYGVWGAHVLRRDNQTGAGHPADEEDSDDELQHRLHLEQVVIHQQVEHAHDAVHVLVHRTPFSNPGDEVAFFMMLRNIILHDITPDGFGLMEEDSPFEVISVGRRGSKQINISLADLVWCDRARLWCQSLTVLLQF